MQFTATTRVLEVQKDDGTSLFEIHLTPERYYLAYPASGTYGPVKVDLVQRPGGQTVHHMQEMPCLVIRPANHFPCDTYIPITESLAQAIAAEEEFLRVQKRS